MGKRSRWLLCSCRDSWSGYPFEKTRAVQARQRTSGREIDEGFLGRYIVITQEVEVGRKWRGRDYYIPRCVIVGVRYCQTITAPEFLSRFVHFGFGVVESLNPAIAVAGIEWRLQIQPLKEFTFISGAALTRLQRSLYSSRVQVS